MPSGEGAHSRDFLQAELEGAILAAIASGRHCDYDLLVLHQHRGRAGRTPPESSERIDPGSVAGSSAGRIPTAEEILRPDLLRSLASLPARSPLGIAAKLAAACRIGGHFQAARETPDGPNGSHLIVSAFIDAMILAQLLPAEAPRHRH